MRFLCHLRARLCGPQPLSRQSRNSSASQRGVALIVTLILLSVVTFLAVAFLFLARRERGAVSTAMEMAVARRSAEAAAEQAKAAVVTSIISTTNPFNYSLLVSTNFVNWRGFDPALINPANRLTNINYDYTINGVALNPDDWKQNIANLYYGPRPPVFVRTNLTRGNTFPLDFRYYLDLNENGRYDTNGQLGEIGWNGLPIMTVDTNNNPIISSNFFVGDPEWIGLLERPERPHSASNKFIGRFAFIVVPSGKTLDINTIHNQAKHSLTPISPLQDGFLRNMGVGPWEMNLGSFLADLNTNYWSIDYLYRTNLFSLSTGPAFEDALALTRYRYGWNLNNLRSFAQLFGAPGDSSFGSDMADGYGSGPLMVGTALPTADLDAAPPLGANRVTQPWPGAENPNHFFTVHDLLDRSKTTGAGQAPPFTFMDRLRNAGYGTSTYDRYTYYRLLSQLGTDSGPDAPKMHLNYANVDNTGKVVPNAQTNFAPWNPVQFFTNAADRMLRANFANPNANLHNFGIFGGLSITNVPVWVSNRFVYTPSLHRVFQIAANMWDATTNKTAALGADFPSVFRPVFRHQKNPAGMTDLYITGFEEVGAITGTGDPRLALPLDLNDSGDLDKAILAIDSSGPVNIYGVPWVIGARKGFPNFNEFAMQSVVQMSRSLQLRRRSITAPVQVYATNQMFSIGISNAFAFEAWNSYQANYTRAVDIMVANDVSIAFNYTNDVPFDLKGGSSVLRYYLTTNVLTIPANTWRGYGRNLADATAVAQSFVVPLQTNIIYLSNSVFRTVVTPTFDTRTNLTSGILFRGYEQTGKFHIPQFTYAVSNRIRFIMVDKLTGRVVDYVQLNDLNGVRNLTTETTDSGAFFVDATSGAATSEAVFWLTNRMGGNARIENPPMGVVNQIRASLGDIDVPDWRSFGSGAASGATKQKEIDGFRNFMGLAPRYGSVVNNTNFEVQAPFTPIRKTSQYLSWQANDPLVHYTAGDLAYLQQGAGLKREAPNNATTTLGNIRVLNDRFEPWGGRQSSSTLETTQPPTVPLFSVEAKDPGIRVPDDWDFPTNKYATLGMLGRVHRGTPWQTVYLKANSIGNNSWSKWTGNSNATDLAWSKPVYDRLIFDLFTTAVDDHATRGRLNVNQTGLAAWSALLGGVIGITNVATDAQLEDPSTATNFFEPYIIAPAGTEPDPTNSIVAKIHAGVNRTRAAAYQGSFQGIGDILAVPELTIASPLLNTNSAAQLQKGINDAVYERLPQMLLGLLRGNDQPRFEIYAFGQALRPANNSIVTAAPFYGLCTNYQITAEFATRTVVRVETTPNQNGTLSAKTVVESFNILPPP